MPDLPEFNDAVRSQVIHPDLIGDAAKIGLVYDVLRALEWPTAQFTILAPLDAANDALVARRQALEARSDTTKSAERTPAEKAALLADWEALAVDLEAHHRETWLLTIDHNVVRVDWPFAPPAPTPGDHASWAKLPNPLIRWIAEVGLAQTQAEWAGPKFAGR